MKALATAALTLALAAPALAQTPPARTDQKWARDVGTATMTLDGAMNEPQWAQASTIPLKWNQNAGLPGSGQNVEAGTLVDPPDPSNATIYVLRKGNVLWIAADVPDKSIFGSRDIYQGDNLIMSITNRTVANTISTTDPNRFGTGNFEFIYGWNHRGPDTLSNGQLVPGIRPRAFGNYGTDFNESVNGTGGTYVRRDTTIWNYRTVVTGTANNDAEARFLLKEMGLPFRQAGATGAGGAVRMM